MLAWFKKLLGETNTDHLKNFDDELTLHGVAEYRKLGQYSIPLERVVGSVGRAHELNSHFRYRDRATTNRYHRLDLAIGSGQPMDPIKVIGVKRENGQLDYYVVDGHHRVAEALKHGFTEINAEVTEAILADQGGDNAAD